MPSTRTQIQSPLDAIIFDCDGTLSAIEGIDELARQNGVAPQVEALTAIAMGSSGIHPDIYRQRLDLVKPQRQQVLELGDDYFQQRMPDADAIVRIFQRLKKAVYLVSAGLLPAVRIFADHLQIPAAHVYAVDVEFDLSGNYRRYDTASPLTHANGKRQIVESIKQKYPDVAYVGDGLNDLAVYDLVSRFIGVGGAYYRANIEARCEFYSRAKSLTPLLYLLLTENECRALHTAERALLVEGIKLVEDGEVKVS